MVYIKYGCSGWHPGTAPLILLPAEIRNGSVNTVQNRPPWLCVKTSTLFSRNIQYHKENVQPPTRLTPFDDAIVSFNHPAKFWDPKKRLKKMVSKIFLKGRLTIPKI